MAPPLMKAAVTRGLPLSLATALAVWTALDLGLHAPPAAALGGAALTAAALAGTVQGSRSRLVEWHRAARALLGVTYVGQRLLWEGVDPLPMMAFLVLLMGLGSLQALERTFAPVYGASDPASPLLARVDAAAVGAYARAVGLLAFTFVASVLLALLMPLAVVRDSSLIAAVLLSLGLLLVIAALALAPVLPLRRRV